jgi:hypothetical protein
MVGGEIGYQGASLRDMLYRWRIQGQVILRYNMSIILLTKCRIIGFEELGNVDGFETAVLELRLSTSGRSIC